MKEKSKIYQMALIGVVAAVICVVGPFSIPIGPVPISFTLLAILIGVYALGTKSGTIACLIYILIGLVGIPVFSGFSGGPSKLFGPTGGYIIGYIFLALIAGWFIDHFNMKVIPSVIGMILGVAVCYTFGTIWLAYQAQMTAEAALMAGVIPFIPFDIIKIIIALILGTQIRKALKKAGFYP